MLAILVLGVTKRGDLSKAWRLLARTEDALVQTLAAGRPGHRELAWGTKERDEIVMMSFGSQMWCWCACSQLSTCAQLPLCVLRRTASSRGIVETWLETKAYLNCGHLNSVTVRVVF